MLLILIILFFERRLVIMALNGGFLHMLFLLFLGLCGWKIGEKIHLPVPSLLGPLFFLGLLKIIGISLPPSPSFFAPILQIFLGVMVGSRFTRDTFSKMRALFLPGAAIIIWALAVVFLLGSFLAQVTYLDPFTAILSSSMGGLPEMTIIALAVEADLGVILTIQLSRLLATFILFPLYIKSRAEKLGIKKREDLKEEGKAAIDRQSFHWPYIFPMARALFIGGLGGLLFLNLGVPAGGMVGSMVFVVLAIFFGLETFTPPPSLFTILLIGVGVIAADSISPSTFTALSSSDFLLPFILSLIFTFSTSFFVARIIQWLTGWDEATAFLAAAPAGFTAMTLLAIEYNRDPALISMLHLCRLLSLKIMVPLVFMLYVP